MGASVTPAHGYSTSGGHLRRFLFCSFFLFVFSLCFLFSGKTALADPGDNWLFQDSFPIVQSSNQKDIPRADGNLVVWRQDGGLIFGKNMDNGLTQQLSQQGLSAYLNNIDLKSKTAAYQVGDGMWSICTRNIGTDPNNLTSAPENCVAAGQAAGTISLSADGSKVASDAAQGGGIRQSDTLAKTSVRIDSYAFSYMPFYSADNMIYYSQNVPWGGAFYSDVINRWPYNNGSYLTGGGCGANTLRRNVRTISATPPMYYETKTSTGKWQIVQYVGDIHSPNDSIRCAEYPLVSSPGDTQNSSSVIYKDKQGQDHLLIVWQDNRNSFTDPKGVFHPNWDIYMKDMKTGEEVAVCKCADDQTNPSITLDSTGQPFIVWQDNRNSTVDANDNPVIHWDIYGTKLSSAQSLAEKYKPELRMTLGENFEPMPVERFLSATGTYLRKRNDSTFIPILNPIAHDLAIKGTTSDYFVDLAGDSIAAGGGFTSKAIDHDKVYSNYAKPYQEARDKNGQFPRTIYARVVSRPDGNKNSFIQYWIFYYANDHPEMFHEGDWEVVQVDLRGDLTPFRADYSHHGDGFWRKWDSQIPGESTIDKNSDNRPIVYVALGWLCP